MMSFANVLDVSLDDVAAAERSKGKKTVQVQDNGA